MMDNNVKFKEMPWESIAVGARQKTYKSGLKQIRLLHLTDDFLELDWCTKGHVGYIIDGEMTLNFSGKKVTYNQGDAFIIASGNAEKHKAMIRKGHFVELLLVEEMQIS